jgi:ceramide glucosyltransferase
MTATPSWVALARLGCEVWAGTSLFFTLLLLLGLARLRSRAHSPFQKPWPSLLILRPCEGAEPGLHENLLSTLSAHYPGARRVRFLVPSATDPAYQAAFLVIAHAQLPPNCVAEVLTTTPRPFDNRKVAQLSAGAENSHEEIVVTVDSDVYLSDADLPALIGAMSDSAATTAGPVAAAFAAPVEVCPKTLWDRASAALVGGSPQNFLALYGLTGLMGGVPSMAGALCAIRRSALSEIGGFPGVSQFLGEDYELARRLTSRGYRIAVSPLPARCTDGGRTAKDVILRVARWLTVVRAQRPLLLLTYPLLMAATPAVLLWAALWQTSTLSTLAMALLVSRMLLNRCLRHLQREKSSLLVTPLEVLAAELLLWLGLARALGTRVVRWRGHLFRIGAGGRMHPVLAASPTRRRQRESQLAPSSAAPNAMASSTAQPNFGLAPSSSLSTSPTSGNSAPPPESTTA